MNKSFTRPKQLIILSGKGGTGKTSLCAAFAHLSSVPEYPIQSVLADADVDAANLNLVLQTVIGPPREFLGGSLAEIDPEKCKVCGACKPVCRYDAILPGERFYKIDPIACDGCSACVYACPEAAISMVQQQEGNWFQSKTPYGPLFHAELFPGKENSGKLVTLVKQVARLQADDTQSPLVIIDGPPGIGCPVISACSGADLALIVTEPGLAGLHDLKRILETLQHFRVPTIICINKSDVYTEGTKNIHQFAADRGLVIVGEIPFDEHVPLAMLKGFPITEVFPESAASISIRNIWERTLQSLSLKQEM